MLLFAPIGCGPRHSDANTLQFIIESSPNNLDLRQGTDAQSERVGALIYDALVRKDEHFNLQPWLATSWERPDALTWVHQLRQSGEPADVARQLVRAAPLRNAGCSVLGGWRSWPQVELRLWLVESGPLGIPGGAAQSYRPRRRPRNHDQTRPGEDCNDRRHEGQRGVRGRRNGCGDDREGHRRRPGRALRPGEVADNHGRRSGCAGVVVQEIELLSRHRRAGATLRPRWDMSLRGTIDSLQRSAKMSKWDWGSESISCWDGRTDPPITARTLQNPDSTYEIPYINFP